MHLSELKSKHVSQLIDLATEAGIEHANRLRKQELILQSSKSTQKPVKPSSATAALK